MRRCTFTRVVMRIRHFTMFISEKRTSAAGVLLQRACEQVETLLPVPSFHRGLLGKGLAVLVNGGESYPTQTSHLLPPSASDLNGEKGPVYFQTRVLILLEDSQSAHVGQLTLSSKLSESIALQTRALHHILRWSFRCSREDTVSRD